MYEVAVYGFEFLIVFMLNLFGVSADSTIVLSFVVLNFLFYFLQYVRDRENQTYYLLIICAYLFRVVFIYIDFFTKLTFLPWSSNGTDCNEFYRQSLFVYLGGTSRHSFASFMGTLMKVFGISRFFWQFMFLTLSIVSLKILYKILTEVDVEEKVKRNMFFVACIFPFIAGYSVVYLRESIVTFLAVFSIYFFIKWIKSGLFRFFILCNMVSVVACIFHAALIGFNIAYIFIYAFYNIKEKHFSVSFVRFFVSILLFFILYFLYVRYGEILFGKISGIESIEDTVISTADGGSSYKQYVGNSSTIFNLIIYTPLRLIFFLFSPFMFWRFRGINDIITFLFDCSFYIVCAVYSVKYLFSKEYKKDEKRNIALCIFLMAIITSFIFAWGTINTGTAIRHRANLTFNYVIVLGLIFSYRKPKQVRVLKKLKELKKWRI